MTEAKISDLLGESPTSRYEASGVVVRDGVSFVVFDNMPHIGRIAGFTPGAEENALQKKTAAWATRTSPTIRPLITSLP